MSGFFALHERGTFLYFSKEKYPKEMSPNCVGLTATLRAFGFSGRCETRFAQTVLALFPENPAVLDNTMGE